MSNINLKVKQEKKIPSLTVEEVLKSLDKIADLTELCEGICHLEMCHLPKNLILEVVKQRWSKNIKNQPV